MADKGLGRGEGVTVGVVAQALRLSIRSVQRLTAEEGMPGRVAPGRYDLGAVVAWFINREVERRAAGGVDDERLIERLRRGVDSGAIRASGDTRRASG